MIHMKLPLQYYRLLVFIILLISVGASTSGTLAATKVNQDKPQVQPTSSVLPQQDPNLTAVTQSFKNYLPFVIRQNANFMMLGVYTPGYTGSQQVIDNELRAMDKWTGKQHSIVGLFVDLKDGNPAYNIPTQLESLYKSGYTAFINLQADNTMAEIANGAIDAYIRNTARAFASWAKQGGDRVAFIAPFTEMNGDWTTYGGDPANFKIGFGPNGWSPIPFENYYPGDNLVDINAFSSYNYGYCPVIAPWQQWKSPQIVYDQYIQRLKSMAPNKPIFVAQTGTTGLAAYGMDPAMKNQWLTDALNYLAADPYVRAFIYVNLSVECDWPIYTTSGVRFDGYPIGAANPNIIYKSPSDLKIYNFEIQP
jgi:hypothetical protein